MPLIPDSTIQQQQTPFGPLDLAQALFLQNQIPSGSSSGSNASTSAIGWTAAPGGWVYTSADSPTFVMSSGTADYTNTFWPGQKLRLVQSTTRYFIITQVAFSAGNTVLTVYGGTDYTLANSQISSVYYSDASAPFGFPTDPSKWTVSLTDTTDANQNTPTANTWYNLGGLSVDIPIGVWRISASGEIRATLSSGTTAEVTAALSTSNSSVSDTNMQSGRFRGVGSGATVTYAAGFWIYKHSLTLTSKTTHYLLGRFSASNGATLQFSGSTDGIPTRVRVESLYL